MRVAGIPLGVGNGAALLVDPLLMLIHFEGANNSTNFVDSSSYSNVLTPYANIGEVLSTTEYRFGTSSLLTHGQDLGQNEGVSCVNSPTFFDMDNSNFTIECWFRQSYQTWAKGLFSCQGNSSYYRQFSVYIHEGSLRANIQLEGDTDVAGQTIAHQNSVSITEWHHVALVRNGTQITLYLDGVASSTTLSVGTTSLKSGVVNSITTLLIGTAAHELGSFVYSLNGYTDEFRLIKTAMYLSDFTPPTAPFTA